MLPGIATHDDAEMWVRQLLPDCKKRDILVDLVRTGVKFKRQQNGRKRGPVYKLVLEAIEELSSPTFENLLDWLETLAVRGDIRVDRVNRINRAVVLYIPAEHRRVVSFGRLRNILTELKKKHFTDKPNP